MAAIRIVYNIEMTNSKGFFEKIADAEANTGVRQKEIVSKAL